MFCEGLALPTEQQMATKTSDRGSREIEEERIPWSPRRTAATNGDFDTTFDNWEKIAALVSKRFALENTD